MTVYNDKTFFVAVRVKGNQDDYNFETDDFDDFVELVTKLKDE